MVNILMPCMGKSVFFEESYFPKLMTEIRGKTMLEHSISTFDTVEDKKMIFVFGKKECMNFHLDDMALILSDGAGEVITLANETAGALCTCMMAIEYIDSNESLIISNSDQKIDININDVISYFKEKDSDAGVITFQSVHPRWSYVRVVDEHIVEVEEKRPISDNAIAGWYFFKRGKDFIKSAKKVLLKGVSKNGVYYISQSLNEMILDGALVDNFHIDNDEYHSFYSKEKINDYENDSIRREYKLK